MTEAGLCQACVGVLRDKPQVLDQADWHGEIGRGPYDLLHHRSYSSFVASKESGCGICNWIWAKHIPPRKSSSTAAGPAVEGFRTYSRPASPPDVSFCIVCPWASDIPVRVSFSVHRDSYGYGETRGRSLHRDALQSSLGSLPGSSIGSDLTIGVIQSWLATCDAEHTLCSHAERSVFCPTRLIDVKEIENATVSLREKNEILAEHMGNPAGTCPPYLTLSHCWGNAGHVLRLLQGNVKRFRDGIPVRELSKTFYDAMLLVHRLGHRYLWIDSLCIFQDSEKDWQKEASTMQDIYSHSFCNIAAESASEAATRGLFGPRQDEARFLYPFIAKLERNTHESRERVNDWNFWNHDMWADEVENAPLNTRGWVVQERFLSPRIVHFSRNQVFWECLEHLRCEIDPDGRLGTLDDYTVRAQGALYKSALGAVIKAPRQTLDWALPSSDPDAVRKRHEMFEQVYELYKHWGPLINTYTACALTKERDGLIAMSGIAKKFQQVSNDTYLAGLWQSGLHMDLSWHSHASRGARVQRRTTFAPSWSWASLVGPVSLVFHSKYGGPPGSLVTFRSARIETELPGGDPMGLVRSAELDVDCTLFHFRWTRDSRAFNIFLGADMTESVQSYSNVGLMLDTTELVELMQQQPEKEGSCIPLYKAYQGYGSFTTCLMLLEVVSGSVYRRVGIAEFSSTGSMPNSNQAQTRITLV